jgi:hypothetical protein
MKTIKLNSMLACQVAAKRMTAVLSKRQQTNYKNQSYLVVDSRNVVHATCQIEKIKKVEDCTETELKRLAMNPESLKKIFGYVHFIDKIQEVPARILNTNIDYGWSELIEEHRTSMIGMRNLLILIAVIGIIVTFIILYI